VPRVPRRKYDDEALRARALELRSRGLSYRGIACELGCSVFKVYQLISSYESPRSRVGRLWSLLVELKSSARRFETLRF
jgi:orotate phosphoribosyltransferase-like protein